MNKYLFLVCLLFFSVNEAVFATDITNNVIDDVDELYQVHAPSSTSLELVNSTMLSATYSTNNYEEGLFDLYGHLIDSHDLRPHLIDNVFSGGGLNSVGWGTREVFTINLKRSLDFTGVFFRVPNVNPGGVRIAQFYDSDGVSLGSINSNGLGSRYLAADFKNVKKIEVNLGGVYKLQEIEFFIDPSVLYNSVYNITSTARDTTAKIMWTNPDDSFFTANKVYLDDVLVAEGEVLRGYDLTDLQPETDYKVTISALYDTVEVKKDYYLKTNKDMTPPSNVTNLVASQVSEDAVLKWDNPLDVDFKSVLIYQGGIKIAEVEATTTTYTVPDAPKNIEVYYRVVAVDKAGNVSSGVTIKAKVIGSDAYDVVAKAESYDKVALTWKNTPRTDFETVKIYRKKETGVVAAVMSFFSFSSSAGYSPLFETNGTVFNDLTVESDTTYEYKLTSFTSGTESAGVTTTVKTPKVSVSGGGIVESGTDYVITWDKPTTGQMQVLIAGVQYAIVPASDKSITIPKSQMKYDMIGRPDVKLVPISADGSTGVPSSPGGGGGGGGGLGGLVGGGVVAAVLNPTSLLSAGVDLLGVVGMFVLLGLSFLVAPHLIKVIKRAYHGRRST